jgi:hypothetical protein
MTTFTATITIEADTLDQALEIFKTWTLSPGAMILSIGGVPQYTEGLPMRIPDDGRVRIAPTTPPEE